MKRIYLLVFFMLIGSGAFANGVFKTVTSENIKYESLGIRSWYLEGPEDSYSVTNVSKSILTYKLSVNAKISKKNLDADPLYFICHGIISSVMPGESTTCSISPREYLGFKILPGKFKNGSEGTYSRIE